MGKIIKNIILILIGFLFITGIFAAFSKNSATVKDVQLSEIINLVDQQKVDSLSVSSDSVTAKIKGSDTQESATLGQSNDIYQILKDSGLSQDKIRAVNVGIYQHQHFFFHCRRGFAFSNSVYFNIPVYLFFNAPGPGHK